MGLTYLFFGDKKMSFDEIVNRLRQMHGINTPTTETKKEESEDEVVIAERPKKKICPHCGRESVWSSGLCYNCNKPIDVAPEIYNLYNAIPLLDTIPLNTTYETRTAKARFSSATTFKNLLNSILIINEEARLLLEPEGLSVIEMDPAHISLIWLKIPKNSFDDYEVPDTVVMPLNIDKTIKFFKNIGKDYQLTIQYEGKTKITTLINGQTETEYLEPKASITFTTPNKTTRKTFELPVLRQDDTSKIAVPILNFTATALVDIDKLVEYLNDANIISEQATFEIDENNFTIRAKGESNEKYTATFERYDDTLHELNVKTPAKATLRLTYLLKILKTIKPLSDTVEVHLAINKPVKLSVPLPEIKLYYLIAPVIEP